MGLSHRPVCAIEGGAWGAAGREAAAVSEEACQLVTAGVSAILDSWRAAVLRSSSLAVRLFRGGGPPELT